MGGERRRIPTVSHTCEGNPIEIPDLNEKWESVSISLRVRAKMTAAISVRYPTGFDLVPILSDFSAGLVSLESLS
jgi:hypothetical protein